MAPPRVGVRMLMAAVAVFAVNIALWRAVSAYERAEYTGATDWDLLVEFVPLSLVPQVALLAAFRRTGPRRTFWLGFCAWSALVLLSRVWYWYDPPVTSSLNPATGLLDDGIYTTRGCAIAPLWTCYSEFVESPCNRYLNVPIAEFVQREFQRNGSFVSRFSEAEIMRWIQVIPGTELVIFLLAPQLLIAWSGGAATRAIVERWARRSTGRVMARANPAAAA